MMQKRAGVKRQVGYGKQEVLTPSCPTHPGGKWTGMYSKLLHGTETEGTIQQQQKRGNIITLLLLSPLSISISIDRGF